MGRRNPQQAHRPRRRLRQPPDLAGGGNGNGDENSRPVVQQQQPTKKHHPPPSPIQNSDQSLQRDENPRQYASPFSRPNSHDLTLADLTPQSSNPPAQPATRAKSAATSPSAPPPSPSPTTPPTTAAVEHARPAPKPARHEPATGTGGGNGGRSPTLRLMMVVGQVHVVCRPASSVQGERGGGMEGGRRGGGVRRQRLRSTSASWRSGCFDRRAEQRSWNGASEDDGACRSA